MMTDRTQTSMPVPLGETLSKPISEHQPPHAIPPTP
jgi:hypothetical protein